jgi:uncharacterized membrane protein YoaK (UPF0700 family)/anti-anti-sigma regulatory factor
MLSARSYSFRQQSRLAISLSWIGGYTNIITFLSCGRLVSHVTGTVTMFGHSAAQHASADTLYFAFLLGLFGLGAALSAVMTEMAKRRGKRSKYVIPMAAQAVCLLIVAIGLHAHPRVAANQTATIYWMTGLASLAMGLQNATITKISGAVVRTTHLSGILTDLGLESVQFFLWYRDQTRGRQWARTGRVLKISQRHPSFLRLLLLASIFGSFLFGVIGATYIYGRWPTYALLPPVAFLTWIILLDWFKPIADVRELDLLSDPELKIEGIVKNLLPPELSLYRLFCRDGRSEHRAPNFQLWADRLPAQCRVLILAVSPLTRFDSNAVLDLEAAVHKLHARDMKVILSGITPTQYRSLDAQGVKNIMNLENLCPDLELAIARGINLVRELTEAGRMKAAV